MVGIELLIGPEEYATQPFGRGDRNALKFVGQNVEIMNNMEGAETAGNQRGTHQMSPALISCHQMADQVSLSCNK